MNTESKTLVSTIARDAIAQILEGRGVAGGDGLGDVVIVDAFEDDRRACYRIVLPDLAGVTTMGHTIGVAFDVDVDGRVEVQARIITEDFELPEWRTGGMVNREVYDDCLVLGGFDRVPNIDVRIRDNGPELNLSSGHVDNRTIEFHQILMRLAMDVANAIDDNFEPYALP